MPNDFLIVSDSDVLIVESESDTLHETVEKVIILSVAEQGPPGPPGVPGTSAGQAVQRISGSELSALVMVYEDHSGVVWTADPAIEAHVDVLLGITLNSSPRGEPINVQSAGVVDDDSWSFTPGGRVYLAAQGRLTQTPPLAGYDVLIGVALSATRLLLNIQDPIELE